MSGETGHFVDLTGFFYENDYIFICFKGNKGVAAVHGSGDDAVIQGIFSFGNNCFWPIHPGVYTRVSRYIDWINKQY